MTISCVVISVDDISDKLKEELMEHVTIHEQPNRSDIVPLSQPMRKRGALGEFKPVRRNSILGNILATIQENPGIKLAELSAKVAMDEEKVVLALKRARALHGIDYNLDMSVTVPSGHDLFREAKPKLQPRDPSIPRTHTRIREEIERAREGIMPEKPIIKGLSGLHRQRHFDNLENLALVGNWDAVAEYPIKGIDGYWKMIRRYRDNLITAHEMQKNSQKAA